MKISRKQFLETALAAAGALVGLGASGCSSSDSTPSGGGDCSSSNASVTIEGNHGHVLKVTSAQVKAMAGKTYHIQGSAQHDHTVQLSSAQFQQLANGGTVYVNSSTANAGTVHDHAITIMCV